MELRLLRVSWVAAVFLLLASSAAAQIEQVRIGVNGMT